jgi:hypothetical protein
MAANHTLKKIGGNLKIVGGVSAVIAFLLMQSYCSEWPKYRFERVAAETGREIPGARLISSFKSGDLASPVSWFWPATTNWTFAVPDQLTSRRFYTMTMVYNEEPFVFMVDADCEDHKLIWYDLDEPESAFPARDFGDPVVAPNGKTYRRMKETNTRDPPQWLHAFCETDWTAEKKAVNSAQ